ncbi:Cytochrome b-c1 complex subunit 1, partial [Diplonema papillatum]
MSASLSTITMAKNPKILHSGQLFIQNFLNRHAPVEVNKLGNGFKVATQEGGANGYATVAVHSKSGSRFDTEASHGVSHLVQKAMWHGTQTKSAADVKGALDSIGGRIRFEQGREVQSVYIDCLGADSAKAVDLLAEVTRKPKFDAAALEAARSQVLGVMKDDENNLPGQVLHNLYRNGYESTRFEAGSGLALNPYGNGDVVKDATAEQLARFHSQYASCPETMALVATGDVKTSTILEKAEQ